MQTDRERALFGARGLKPVGSPAWCWQTIDLLQERYRQVHSRFADVESVLAELEEARAWEAVPPEAPYGSLEALLHAELGISERDLREHALTARERAERAAPIGPAVHPGTGKGNKTGRNPTRFRGADYWASRLARDRPDLLRRVESGEFPSIQHAVKAAGWASSRIMIRLDDSESAARTILRNGSPEFCAELRRLLANGCQIHSGLPRGEFP